MGGSKEGTQGSREKIIIRTSVIGIAANVFLAAFKAFVGISSHSIAIVNDAINNLSDALSSVITIIGTKLAGRAPDKNHPLGHGRIEYLSAMIISVIVLYAGITSFVESVKKIIHPETPDYSTAALIIVAAAIAVKLILGRFVKKTGEKVDSDSLIASGADATMDAAISTTTLVAAIIYLTTHVSLEAWLGAIISVVIIKSGYEMLQGTLSDILGQRAPAELTRNIKRAVADTEGVLGAYDLFLHDYGPDRTIGSIHIEVPDNYTASKIDEITRQIQEKIFDQFGVALTGIGIYSANTSKDSTAKTRHEVTKIVMGHDGVLQMHGFYLDEANKTMSFDVVLDFALEDRMGTYAHIVDEVQRAFPDYTVKVALDIDVSD